MTRRYRFEIRAHKAHIKAAHGQTPKHSHGLKLILNNLKLPSTSQENARKTDSILKVLPGLDAQVGTEDHLERISVQQSN